LDTPSYVVWSVG